ncbi:MAG: P1 family peptidase [Kordiimonadaceae bacterium]|nr:P1 family peptidase [Kordiimonadaceae bacterium]
MICGATITLPQVSADQANNNTVRARDIGLSPGILPPGPKNSITDVAGVLVGHLTLIEGTDIRTGATAILPHGGNIYQNKVPAAIVVGNGFGKLAGSTQIEELGEIETPIVLTNTLAVSRGMDAIIDWTLKQQGNEKVRSVNAVVGETNDAGLNNIRRRTITASGIQHAIETALSGPVAEGSVGAGTGTIAFGWKGGIGTSSRKLPEKLGGHTVGVLVQSNFGGILQMDGLPVGKALGQYYLQDYVDGPDADGSIMIVVATDAPLTPRNLKRLGRRALSGLAKTGATMTNGSGDYVILFSTAFLKQDKQPVAATLANNQMSPLFQAVNEATEEAIYNSLLMATSIEGFSVASQQPNHVAALPIDAIRALVKSRDAHHNANR